MSVTDEGQRPIESSSIDPGLPGGELCAQRVSRCRKCERETVIVITSESHELRWCAHCASQLLMKTFDGNGGSQTRSWREIKKWVDNGSVQLIETPETTFIITFDTIAKVSKLSG